ncbi:hypothetical protein [Caballeronia grimmiae]|uniref:hypothetical protein n=1 Tax=Caballeronia grimmiae TaxID=1071679 RepID=UPI0038BD5A53
MSKLRGLQHGRDGYQADAMIAPNNPCLDYLPRWEGYKATIERMTIAPDRRPDGLMPTDAFANFPTQGQAQLARALSQAIGQSALERNPADFGYQQLLLRASMHLADTADVHGHSVPTLPISVRTAGPRGMFVSIPCAMGQHSFVTALENLVGTGSVTFDVDTPVGQPIRVNKLKSLTVEFPANGSPRRFIKTMLKKLDSAVMTGFSDEVKGAFHRSPEDCALSLAALGIQQNLGALLVTGITAKAMAQPGAPLVLMELGQFLVHTGIPVVCVGTPGVAMSLVELGASVSSLYSHGAYVITPFNAEDPHWGLYSEYTWQNYFEDVYGAKEPVWFGQQMLEHCAGHTELLVKVGRYVRDFHQKPSDAALTPEALTCFANTALVMESKPLALLHMVRNKVPFSRGTAMRFADWLPLEAAMKLISLTDEPRYSPLLLPLIGEAS